MDTSEASNITRKRWVWLIAALAIILAFSVVLWPRSDKPSTSPAANAQVEPISTTVAEIKKHGNLLLDISASDLLAAGYDWGDDVEVDLCGQTLDMPVFNSFSGVEQGDYVLLAAIDEEVSEDIVELAINMGDLATTAGIATKEDTQEDPGYVWHLNEGVEDPIPVTITLKGKGTYYDQWLESNLVGSQNREDYPNLTDAEFANFRPVVTGSIKEGVLYRSSSPIDPSIGRNLEADAATKEASIHTIINLEDTPDVAEGYPGFNDTYYSTQNIIAVSLGYDFREADFEEGLADALRFMTENEGPYLVHCKEGKDRTGFVCALLESLMGASKDEIVADYMLTYYNFYGVEPGSEQYSLIAEQNIQKTLSVAFNVDDLGNADLASCAEQYLLDIGLTQEEIGALRACLGN